MEARNSLLPVVGDEIAITKKIKSQGLGWRFFPQKKYYPALTFDLGAASGRGKAFVFQDKKPVLFLYTFPFFSIAFCVFSFHFFSLEFLFMPLKCSYISKRELLNYRDSMSLLNIWQKSQLNIAKIDKKW